MNTQIEIIKIELITKKLGTLTFDKYEIMEDFERNNWKLLGETSYRVHHTLDGDDNVVEAGFIGINASAELSMYLEIEN